MNTLSENACFYISKNITSYIFSCLFSKSSKAFSVSLSWDAMLSMTKVELELISDADMYLFIERVIRGGVSYVSKRYSKANNK